MDNSEYGARVRAAQAYKGLLLDQFVTATGIKKRTLSRILAGKRVVTMPEAARIAEATGVPIAFLLYGWQAEGALSSQTRGADPQPPGELGRRAEGSQPTARDHLSNGHQEEQGTRQGAGG